MRTRSIPVSDEPLPVIGLGTYNVFDVQGTPAEIAERREILDLFTTKGASLIDSSPMYNRSEKIIGDVLRASRNREQLFIATKVWIDGKEAGEGQMQQSADLMNAGTIDLMQVHNLRDLDVQMATIRDWQAEKRIRYNGVTHYRASALDDLEAVMRSQKPEFIQINYSLGEREADKRVLPLALDLGIAVLINRPYMTGRLFRAVSGQDLPDWASEFAGSWGQFFLKYIVSHPAATCVIPATSKPHHMADNLEAGFGPLPDESTRQKMVELIDRLS
jgi:diketogulonate reductase-like aldo/keto reductase